MKLVRWTFLVIVLIAVSGCTAGRESGSPVSLDAASAEVLSSLTTAPGYWLVSSDGGVFTFGDAQFYGSTGGMHANKPVVGMAADARRRGATGWWPPTAGSSASATPAFYGSTGGITLNKPIVGMAATPDGRGYWLVASDGGIFAFGDAGFYGSTGGTAPEQADRRHGGHARRPGLLAGGLRRRDLRLRRRRLLRLDRGHHPQQAGRRHGGDARRPGLLAGRLRRRDLQLRRRRASTGPPAASPSTSRSSAWRPPPDGKGYWLVASDGGMFSFGDAHFYGSTGGLVLNKPVVGMSTSMSTSAPASVPAGSGSPGRI